MQAQLCMHLSVYFSRVRVFKFRLRGMEVEVIIPLVEKVTARRSFHHGRTNWRCRDAFIGNIAEAPIKIYEKLTRYETWDHPPHARVCRAPQEAALNVLPVFPETRAQHSISLRVNATSKHRPRFNFHFPPVMLERGTSTGHIELRTTLIGNNGTALDTSL